MYEFGCRLGYSQLLIMERVAREYGAFDIIGEDSLSVAPDDGSVVFQPVQIATHGQRGNRESLRKVGNACAARLLNDRENRFSALFNKRTRSFSVSHLFPFTLMCSLL